MNSNIKTNLYWPRSNLLRWEIGIALLLKIILLTGLWFLIFRWEGKPIDKPDVATHFALPTQRFDIATQPPKESNHVR